MCCSAVTTTTTGAYARVGLRLPFSSPDPASSLSCVLHSYAWDSQLATEAGSLQAHENRVSCVGVSRDGKALCTGSWDTLLRIWA